jgi:hypothetical protein
VDLLGEFKDIVGEGGCWLLQLRLWICSISGACWSCHSSLSCNPSSLMLCSSQAACKPCISVGTV